MDINIRGETERVTEIVASKDCGDSNIGKSLLLSLLSRKQICL